MIAKRVVSVHKRPDSQSLNKGSEGSESSGEVVGGLWEEIATLREQLEAEKCRVDEAEALASAKVELVVVEWLREELGQEKKYKCVWWMSCEQLLEHDVITTAKDEEIATLKEQVRVLELSAVPAPTGGEEEVTVVGGARPTVNLSDGAVVGGVGPTGTWSDAAAVRGAHGETEDVTIVGGAGPTFTWSGDIVLVGGAGPTGGRAEGATVVGRGGPTVTQQ